jgi:hypothetical protein
LRRCTRMFHNGATETTETRRENGVTSCCSAARAPARAGARLGRAPGSQAHDQRGVLVILMLGPTWPRFARRELCRLLSLGSSSDDGSSRSGVRSSRLHTTPRPSRVPCFGRGDTVFAVGKITSRGLPAIQLARRPSAGARVGRVPGSQAHDRRDVLVIQVLGPPWPRYARRELYS